MLFIIYDERQNQNEADPKPVLCNNMSKFDFAARTTTANVSYYIDIVIVSVREFSLWKYNICICTNSSIQWVWQCDFTHCLSDYRIFFHFRLPLVIDSEF